MTPTQSVEIEVLDAPVIPGLTFRHFRGEPDYPAIVAVTKKSGKADQIEGVVTVEDIAVLLAHFENFDPYKDILFVEMSGGVIGYSFVWWNEDANGMLVYRHFADLIPEWRGTGIRHAMVRYNERRLREIASAHPKDRKRYFRVVIEETEVHMGSVLVDEGYTIMRYGVTMMRPNLDNVPDFPLPKGVEVRPVRPEHYPAIMKAWNEACKDMRGQIPLSEGDFRRWQEDPDFDPSLWQVAWHDTDVVGTVLAFINEKENQVYNRKRARTEFISVARPWRNKGIAKALIARALNALKKRGMTEAALSVDTENPSGALKLYKKMGYTPVKRAIFYWKPLDYPLQ